MINKDTLLNLCQERNAKSKLKYFLTSNIFIIFQRGNRCWERLFASIAILVILEMSRAKSCYLIFYLSMQKRNFCMISIAAFLPKKCEGVFALILLCAIPSYPFLAQFGIVWCRLALLFSECRSVVLTNFLIRYCSTLPYANQHRK